MATPAPVAEATTAHPNPELIFNTANAYQRTAALKSGGRAVTFEFIPNDDRVSPPVAAAFPMLMLAGTPSGDAYTFAEFERMFKAAGFAKNVFIAPPDAPQQIIISQR